jgi:hypothetical protein
MGYALSDLSFKLLHPIQKKLETQNPNQPLSTSSAWAHDSLEQADIRNFTHKCDF